MGTGAGSGETGTKAGMATGGGMGLAEWCRGTLNPLGSELAATMS